MKIPVIRGVIDRRILVNHRVDPAILAQLLPPPFRPQVVHGVGVAGICLIRLNAVRPAFLPHWIGFNSENAAHRAAVEWDENGTVRQGVYVRRRDTNSRLNSLVGGRIFPGIHHHASFKVTESASHSKVSLRSDDGVTSISVHGRRTSAWPPASVFKSMDEASQFFQSGSLGYSGMPQPSRFQGLELKCLNWHVEPLEIDEVRSSFFDDESLFPKESIAFDCALLMQGIHHEWHRRSDLCCDEQRIVTASNP